MRELIIFTNEELQQLSTVGQEIDFKTNDGRTFTFMSEDTYEKEYRHIAKKEED